MMQERLKLISFFFLALIFSIGCNAQNKSSIYPEGCEANGYKFSGKELVLNSGGGENLNLFLIYNVSEGTVYMNHEPKDDPGASAGWSTELDAGNWTAVSQSTPEFSFTCGKLVPGKFDEIACIGVLKVCKYKDALFSKGAEGSYWVAENKPLNDLLGAIKTQGHHY